MLMGVRLEELTKGARVCGVAPAGPVTVIDADWIGSDVLNLTYEDALGNVERELLYRTSEPELSLDGDGRPWSLDADPHLSMLVSEAKRIQLAYLFDPFLAAEISDVDALPHQIEAVYGEMLPAIRFESWRRQDDYGRAAHQGAGRPGRSRSMILPPRDASSSSPATTGSRTPGSQTHTYASRGSAVSEVISHRARGLIHPGGQKHQQLTDPVRLRQMTIGVAVKQADTGDRRRLEHRSNSDAQVSPLDLAHRLSRYTHPLGKFGLSEASLDAAESNLRAQETRRLPSRETVAPRTRHLPKIIVLISARPIIIGIAATRLSRQASRGYASAGSASRHRQAPTNARACSAMGPGPKRRRSTSGPR